MGVGMKTEKEGITGTQRRSKSFGFLLPCHSASGTTRPLANDGKERHFLCHLLNEVHRRQRDRRKRLFLKPTTFILFDQRNKAPERRGTPPDATGRTTPTGHGLEKLSQQFNSAGQTAGMGTAQAAVGGASFAKEGQALMQRACDQRTDGATDKPIHRGAPGSALPAHFSADEQALPEEMGP